MRPSARETVSRPARSSRRPVRGGGRTRLPCSCGVVVSWPCRRRCVVCWPTPGGSGGRALSSLPARLPGALRVGTRACRSRPNAPAAVATPAAVAACFLWVSRSLSALSAQVGRSASVCVRGSSVCVQQDVCVLRAPRPAAWHAEAARGLSSVRGDSVHLPSVVHDPSLRASTPSPHTPPTSSSHVRLSLSRCPQGSQGERSVRHHLIRHPGQPPELPREQ